MNTIKKGDRVRYARKFLQTSGCFTRGQGAFRAGTVDALDTAGAPVAFVVWDDAPDEVQCVLACNLVRADSLHLEAY